MLCAVDAVYEKEKINDKIKNNNKQAAVNEDECVRCLYVLDFVFLMYVVIADSSLNNILYKRTA